MSALPPKADIGTQSRNVRFVPKADICSAANNRWSRTDADGFSPRVRKGAERFWHAVITAGRPRDLLFSVERIGGNLDNRDRPQRRISLDPMHWSGLTTRVMPQGITSVDSFEIDLP